MVSAFQVQERYFYKTEDKPRGARAGFMVSAGFQGLGFMITGSSFVRLGVRIQGSRFRKYDSGFRLRVKVLPPPPGLRFRV